MGIDTQDKRASCIGVGLPPLAVLPKPGGAVTIGDRLQLAYTYRILDEVIGAQVYRRRVGDTIFAFDLLVSERGYTRAQLDALQFLDSATPQRFRWALADADTLALSDAARLQANRERAMVDALLVADLPSVVDRHFTRAQLDALGLTDIPTRQAWRMLQRMEWLELLDAMRADVISPRILPVPAGKLVVRCGWAGIVHTRARAAGVRTDARSVVRIGAARTNLLGVVLSSQEGMLHVRPGAHRGPLHQTERSDTLGRTCRAVVLSRRRKP